MKTLIVEDELTSRLLLQGLLSRYGVCHTVVDGAEALEAFRAALDTAEPYSLVCMDILMPGVEGIDVVKLMRDLEEARNIPFRNGARIVMTTGVASTREIFRSFANLCDAYVSKPIDGALLHKHLQRMSLIQ